jgi:hypothetical protein
MKPELSTMTRQELKEYILEHREDEEAFRLYMDIITSEPGEIYPAPQSIDDLKNFPELLEKHRQNKQQN